MPDRISSYRQIRLTINLDQTRQRHAGWVATAISVRKGVPYSQALAMGSLDEHIDPSSVDGCLLVIRLVAAHLDGYLEPL